MSGWEAMQQGAPDPFFSPDPKPARAPGVSTAEERREFRVAVLALDGACVLHGDTCLGPVHAHHAIPRQKLRRLGLPEWDPASGFTVCESGHFSHHSRSRPIPRELVPERCVRFAEEHGLSDLLDRLYP